MTKDTTIAIFRGDSENIVVEVKNSAGVGIDITGYTFWFTVKTLESDADASAIIQKEVTVHTTPLSGITTIEIPYTDTEIDAGDYQYDIQMKSTTDDITTLLRGTFRIKQDITLST